MTIFKFYENDKIFQKVENTVGKGEIACYEQFLLFPQCFQKAYTADKGLFWKGLICLIVSIQIPQDKG